MNNTEEKEPQSISKESFKKALNNREPLSGFSELQTAKIKIENFSPHIILCQHSGTTVSDHILEKMDILDFNRDYETDLYLDRLFDNQPITFIATFSRYEFDTNRTKETSLYLTPELAWGAKVYNEPLKVEEKAELLSKFQEFYNYFEILVSEIIKTFGKCIIYDIHSYNITHPDRIGKELPLFNVGTMSIDREKYASTVDNWLEELNKININGETGAKENYLFGGKSGMAKHISTNFPDALIFPVEIKKFYMNEKSSELYEDNFTALGYHLNKAINNNVEFFSNLYQTRKNF